MSGLQLCIPVLPFSGSFEIGANFAFVLTPKSAVKSSRRTKRIFSFVTTFLLLLAHYINRSLTESNHDGYHLFLVLPKILDATNNYSHTFDPSVIITVGLLSTYRSSERFFP